MFKRKWVILKWRMPISHRRVTGIARIGEQYQICEGQTFNKSAAYFLFVQSGS
jgi:hypothetical protein